MSDYPEHDKMSAVTAETQAAGDFIDFLQGEGARLMILDESDQWTYAPGNLNDWLAKWKGINLAVIEQEKRDMLAEIRDSPENLPE
jgi:hypothetical protein